MGRVVTRRRFIGILGAATAAAGTGIYAALGGWQAFSSAAGASAAPLRAPELLQLRRFQSNLIKATVVAAPVTTMVAGVHTQALGYNGSVPGPTLEVREGDTLRLTFVNRLAATDPAGHLHDQCSHDQAVHTEHGSNLHLHGPRIAPTLDAPFEVLAPGESRTIDLDIAAGTAGTHWYHPHPHGFVARQLFQGLSGTMIIRGGLDDELAAWEEHLLVLKDYKLIGGQVASHTFLDRGGKLGDIQTVNGQHRPVLRTTSGALRLRLVNTATARFTRLSLDDHPLHLIATDGHFLEKPVELSELVLAPGNRADVLIKLERSGPLMLSDTGTPLMTLEGRTASRSVRLPESLGSMERLDMSQSVTTRRVTFSGSNVNGNEFSHDRVDFTARLNTLEVWELEIGRHPFHLHSYPVQVIDRDGRPEPYRAWRDVVYGREFGGAQRVRIAVPFRHYAGRTVFHCHISEHEDNGMMAVLDVRA